MSDPLAALRGAIVLVVEDDAPSARLFDKVLRNAGCLVHVVPDATAASLLIFGGLRPAVIILDLDLPEITGMDFVRVLRSVPATAHIPVIAVSASGVGFSESVARASGCDCFVRKPIDVLAFPAIVARQL